MVKASILLVVFSLVFLKTSAQQIVKDTTEGHLITVIEKPPIFSKRDNLLSFIKRNINYPQIAIKDKIEGIVVVEFWIEKDGSTTKHEILRGKRDDLNQEALRIVRLIKFEEPAMQKGKPIKVKYTVPVEFKLHGTNKCKKE